MFLPIVATLLSAFLYGQTVNLGGKSPNLDDSLSSVPIWSDNIRTSQSISKHCDNRVRSIATNFSTDLKGEPDNRENTWGDAGAYTHKLTFRPPAGCRVRIIKVYGDFLIWPIGKVEPGKFAGALLGLQNTGYEGSAYADLAADNTFLYIQTATSGGAARAAFDYDTTSGGLLGRDHVMLVKMAVWLNDTGLKIHMEPSFVAVFQYEDDK